MRPIFEFTSQQSSDHLSPLSLDPAGRGAEESHRRSGSTARPDALSGRSADVISILRGDLYDFSRRTAIASGKLEIEDATLSSLRNHAVSMGESQIPSAFDPESNPHDRELESHRQARQVKLDRLNQPLAWTRKRMEDERLVLARLPNPGLPPCPPYLGVCCCLALFITCLIPSIQTIFDAELPYGVGRWLLPAVISGGIGVALLIPQVRAARSPEASSIEQKLFLVGGLTTALALGIFRFVIAESASGIGVGVALVGLEVAGVLIAEALTSAYRREYLQFRSRLEQFTVQQNIVDIAQAEVQRLESEQQELRLEEGRFLLELRDRTSLVHARATLIESCDATAVDGYTAGISENQALAHRARNDV